MNRRSSSSVLFALAIVLATATNAATTSSPNVRAVPAQDQSAGTAATAPLVVAQGRCFNGRCF